MRKPPPHHDVDDPDNDGRVTAPRGYPDRFRDERWRECLAMIAVWHRSSKPYAGNEIQHWRQVLTEIDCTAGHDRIA